MHDARQVEEKELDADKVQQAMSAIAAAQQADKAAQHLRRVFSNRSIMAYMYMACHLQFHPMLSRQGR